MIRIHKHSLAPLILRTKGVAQQTQMCIAYDSEPEAYRLGVRRFQFDDRIYADPFVKRALRVDQRDKCCFCESRIGDEGDVEHFRPKSAMCQGKRKPLRRPGYYWLAYDWDNLLLCCTVCNQRFKRNYFPLQDDDRRARCHHDDIASETPLFINPAHTDPEQHIEFRDEFAIYITPAGKSTIDGLQLNREALRERRRDRLEAIRVLAQIAAQDASQLPAYLRSHHQRASLIVSKALSEYAEFTLMIRCAARRGYEEAE